MNQQQKQYLADNAERGAALFDVIRPGWYDEVDTSYLDMGHSGTCLLGQTFGWEQGKYVLRAAVGDSRDSLTLCVDHGLLACHEGVMAGCEATEAAQYSFLAECWTRLAEKRRAQAGTMA